MACFLRFAGRQDCTKSFCEKCRELLKRRVPAKPKAPEPRWVPLSMPKRST